MPDLYIDYPVQFDENALYQMAIARIQETFPSWLPIAGSLIDLTLRAGASMAAVGAEVASDVPMDIFRTFGPLAHTPSIDATPAQANVTFIAQDTNGYIVQAGTPVGLTGPGVTDPVAFVTISDLLIPNGAASADAVVVAAIPGSGLSGLDTVARIDSLLFISSITITGVSIGGIDSELTSDYVNRLSQEFETWSTTPILGADFAVIARKVAGVYRCANIDNYNPADDTYNNEKMVALCPIDVNGIAVSGGIQTAVQVLLESLREVNFVCNVMSPSVNIVDVAYVAHVNDPSLIVPTQILTDAAAATVLDPSEFGIPVQLGTGERPIWNNTTTLRINKVIQAIENSSTDVDYVDGVTLGIHGGASAAADLALGGAFKPFPQVQAGTISGSVVSP